MWIAFHYFYATVVDCLRLLPTIAVEGRVIDSDLFGVVRCYGRIALRTKRHVLLLSLLLNVETTLDRSARTAHLSRSVERKAI